MRPRDYARRRGSTYIIVLGSTMVVSVIGLSAVMAIRIERRSTEGNADLIASRGYARSAIELGFLFTQTDANWRSNRSNGNWVSNKKMGTGKYTLFGIDPNDGDLKNSDLDPLVLTGIGTEGEARYELQVSLTARIVPLGCLETAVHAGTGVVFRRATVMCNQTISSNAGISAMMASVTSDVEAVGTITGASYVGTQTTGAAARDMPDITAADFYVNNGTWINPAWIPKVGGVRTIEKVVLSPASNPYTVTNAQGIYYIPCAGQRIRIRNARIVGTLVLINPSPDSEVVGSVNWTPAVSNYPALMVTGNIVLAMSSAALSEAALGVNFNPTGSSFSGTPDTDMTDSYRSAIGGLVYATASVTVYGQTTIDGGLIAGGTVMCQAPAGASSPSFGYKAIYYNNPPPGFTDIPKMVATPGSWKQVVN